MARGTFTNMRQVEIHGLAQAGGIEAPQHAIEQARAFIHRQVVLLKDVLGAATAGRHSCVGLALGNRSTVLGPVRSGATLRMTLRRFW